MEERIKQMFETNRNMMQLLDYVVYYFKRQNMDAGLRNGIHVINEFGNFVKDIFEMQDVLNETGIVTVNQNDINTMLTEILNTQEQGDFVLLCDLYELKLYAFLADIQQALLQFLGEKPFKRYSYEEACEKIKQADNRLGILLGKASCNDREFKNYSIEYCSSGDVTVARCINDKWFYLHSNFKPAEAGVKLAWSWHKPDKAQYNVFGLGLGYHVNELGKIDDTIDINVYEPDLRMLQLAAQYGVLIEFLKNPKHKVVYDPDLKEFGKKLGENEKESTMVIHFPSLQSMENGIVKEKLENYFIQYSSIENQLCLMKGNFRENVKNVPACASELKESWSGKTVYIIAAGPSLDKNMFELRKVSKDSIILAVGTVYRKMMKEKLPVDYVIVSDANKRVGEQINDLEQKQIPLLILATAFHGFAERYQGPKYLIFQKDFELSEKEAIKRDTFLCEVGGSVATAALDLCYKMGVKRVVTVGLDLAFTNNFVHARDTSNRHIADIKYLRIKDDIYGKEVYTSKTMDKYREWIEHWIKRHKGMELYNATEGGVLIQGMKNVILKDIVAEQE